MHINKWINVGRVWYWTLLSCLLQFQAHQIQRWIPYFWTENNEKKFHPQFSSLHYDFLLGCPTHTYTHAVHFHSFVLSSAISPHQFIESAKWTIWVENWTHGPKDKHTSDNREDDCWCSNNEKQKLYSLIEESESESEGDSKPIKVRFSCCCYYFPLLLARNNLSLWWIATLVLAKKDLATLYPILIYTESGCVCVWVFVSAVPSSLIMIWKQNQQQ